MRTHSRNQGSVSYPIWKTFLHIYRNQFGFCLGWPIFGVVSRYFGSMVSRLTDVCRGLIDSISFSRLLVHWTNFQLNHYLPLADRIPRLKSLSAVRGYVSVCWDCWEFIVACVRRPFSHSSCRASNMRWLGTTQHLEPLTGSSFYCTCDNTYSRV